MHSSLFRGFFSLVAVLFLSAVASACMNDRETVPAEREFKSNYMDQKPQMQPAPAPDGSPTIIEKLIVDGGIWSGAFLLVGACVLGWRESCAQ